MSDATKPARVAEQLLEQKREQLEQEQAVRLRRARAFEEVFGRPAMRTESQRLVLEHLQGMSGQGENAFQFDAGKDGIAIALSGAHRDGAQSTLRIIHRQLEIAANSHEASQAKPKKAPHAKR